MAKGSVQIVVERCKACGFCVEFCPTHVLALSSAFNAKGYHTPYMSHPEKCSGCDLCGMYCPDFAIFGFKTEQAHTSTSSGQAALAQAEKAGAPEPAGPLIPNEGMSGAPDKDVKEAQDAR
jgi:2-oxoglutarate ferredoxin oxidoreductase subunit delta